jgi:hypothetical protein
MCAAKCWKSDNQLLLPKMSASSSAHEVDTRLLQACRPCRQGQGPEGLSAAAIVLGRT